MHRRNNIMSPPVRCVTGTRQARTVAHHGYRSPLAFWPLLQGASAGFYPADFGARRGELTETGRLTVPGMKSEGLQPTSRGREPVEATRFETIPTIEGRFATGSNQTQ